MAKAKIITILYGAIAVILLLCLLDMPYGFYSFVRFAAAAAFCYFAYVASQSENKERMILCIALAVLFQPLLKIPLGRTIWNIVDVVVAAYLIYLLLHSLGKNHN